MVAVPESFDFKLLCLDSERIYNGQVEQRQIFRMNVTHKATRSFILILVALQSLPVASLAIQFWLKFFSVDHPMQDQLDHPDELSLT